ncbi:MAG: YebC/PmpR family DNA-binding transcriptional regulator [Burkholderia sp.]|nr:YebC/PmpR family DNA-binding transcriptional regulator [Burkholderia sp.]
MAGHSKWANIKHKKAGADTKRSKVWTRLIKEIYMSAHLGGDPTTNPRLRLAIEKASDANIPKDNIRRAINRVIGNSDEKKNYEEIRYEGYGVGGAAIIIDALTENRKRTVAEVRYVFSKFGGNISSDGSVTFMFERVGKFLFETGTNEDVLLEVILDCGAYDVIMNDSDSIEVLCDWKVFTKVRDILEAAGLKTKSAKVVMIPKKKIEFTRDDRENLQKLLDALESIEDVQEVYTNVVTVNNDIS